MKQCTKCGKEIENEAVFCKFCGIKNIIEEDSDSNVQFDTEEVISEAILPSEKNNVVKKNTSNRKIIIIVAICLIAVTIIFVAYSVINAPLNEAKGYVDDMAKYYQHMNDCYNDMLTTSDPELSEAYSNLFDSWKDFYDKSETQLSNAEEELSDWQKDRLFDYKVKVFTEAGLL